jgi:phosphatidate cytidylyltransferase
MFAVFIPVYAFLFVPMRSVFVGDCERFLERASEIQWGLMICVFCVSHIPALLMLEIPGYEGRNAQLLLFLLFVVELSDILQFVWGKTCGKHLIAPTVSPNKTVEGFFGGVICATIAGTLLARVTPFGYLQTFAISLIVTLMGFAGGLVMSAIKRDRGVKDYGSMLSGHGGMMDRIDSLCFAAPVFFHIVRYYYAA